MFARFDENPAMTLQDIKKTKRFGRTDGQTHARTDNMKTVYPATNKVCGGYNKISYLTQHSSICILCKDVLYPET